MSEDDPGHRVLSDQEALDQLGKLFARVERLQRQLDQLDTVPEPGSSLAEDDRAASGWGVSSTARRNMVTAAEHLDAVRHIMADAHVLPVAAPYTLIRTALECGAAAVWLMAPERRASRVCRCLVLARQDAVDRASMVDLLGAEHGESLTDRQRRFDELAKTVSGDPTKRVGRLKTEQMVRQAAIVIAAPVNIHSTWKACSGLAHGRLWATLAILHREEQATDGQGVTRYRVFNSPGRVLWAAMSATDAVEFGLRLYVAAAHAPDG